MCGIACIFAYRSDAGEVDPAELRAVRDAMTTRGPDGSGEWFSSDRRLAIGHRRLAIIDLSDKGSQPMIGGGGRHVISFNGEIYNYREIRASLEREGTVFRSGSDTEVLLALYAKKGEKMVEDLRGMFAFMIWDAEKRSLLLVRDPFGIKPLYYSDSGGVFRAASQVKALLKAGGVSRESDPAGWAGFFLTGSVPEPRTVYRSIRQVPAGSYIKIGERGAEEPRPYYSMADVLREHHSRHKLPRGELLSLVRSALAESVRYHFVADVPVGIFLSSGIDSSCLTGLASDIGIGDLRTFTLAFREFAGGHLDESKLAEQTSRIYGTRHHTCWLSAEDAKRDLSRFIQAMDQPTIDGMNTYFVSKAAKESGLKVALSGLGCDELFGGYPSFQELPIWTALTWLPARIPFLGQWTRRAAYCLIPTRYSQKAAGIFELGGSYEKTYLLRRGLVMPWELESILGKDAAEEGMSQLSLLERMQADMKACPDSPFAKISVLEASFYMRNQLLRDADWAGMANSVEIRVPFVDRELFRKVAPAFTPYPSGNHKHLLERVPLKSLPVSVMRRKKTGFSVPLDRWITDDKDLDAWKEQPLLNRPGCHWSRRWAYVIHSRYSNGH